jgi:hypothetical protein
MYEVTLANKIQRAAAREVEKHARKMEMHRRMADTMESEIYEYIVNNMRGTSIEEVKQHANFSIDRDNAINENRLRDFR